MSLKEDYGVIELDENVLYVRYEIFEDGSAFVYDDPTKSYNSWYLTYDEIYDELYQTWRNRLKQKHYTHEAFKFERNLGKYLDDLTRQILLRNWKPKGYFDFLVYHPRRVISAPFYKDRIVEEWITERFVKPYLEPKLHPSSAACRAEKGPPLAKAIVLDILYTAYRKYGLDFYIFQYDMQSYYDNVSHERIRDIFSGMEALGRILFMNIVDDWKKSDSYAAELDSEGSYGVPKGNLPSQWIGLAYLNDLDWIISEFPGVLGQVRYMDDGLVAFRTKQECLNLKIFIEHYLVDEKMGIALHPRKTQYFPVSRGFTFCGWRYVLFSDGHIRMREKGERKKITKSRLKKATEDFFIGKLSENDVRAKLNGIKAYLKAGDTKSFLRYLNHRYVFTHDKSKFYKDRNKEYLKKDWRNKLHERKNCNNR